VAEGEPFFDVTFFPDNLTFEPPPEFSSSIVQGKSYDLGDPRYSGYFGDLMQLDAYQWRCAITGSKIRPALQEAHILPVKPAHGGEHRLDNGLLLRSD
jgi:putative restriction endonuclease